MAMSTSGRAWRIGGVALGLCAVMAAGVSIALAEGEGEARRERVRDPGPVLTLHKINNRHWTLRYRVNLGGVQVGTSTLDTRQVATSRVVAEKVAMVFPILVEGTCMSETWVDEVTGFMRWGRPGPRFGEEVTRPARRVAGYQGPTELLVYEGANINTRLLEFEVEVPVTSYETRIDEGRAFRIDWPSEPYKPEIALNLEEQLFIEVGHPDIARLVEVWTKGNPQKVKPYALAKHLAGKVVEHYQPSGGILEGAFVGFIPVGEGQIQTTGFRVSGAAQAARAGKGPPLDMANLLTAVYRTAGLPARTVIALELPNESESNVNGREPCVRAWTEFYLYDERFDRGEWIPVDIQRQRAFSSVAPPLDQRWEYFGRNEDFEFVVPIAFHWHPPTVVTNAGAPAIYGWITEPNPPRVNQEIIVTAMGTGLDFERQQKRQNSERLREQGGM